MKIQYLGTAAAEGLPGLFCECDNCRRARELGGRAIRTRSQALVDGKLLIDFPADTYLHALRFQLPMQHIHTLLITHSHSDHLYAADLEMRKDFLAHLQDKNNPLCVYSDRSSFALIHQLLTAHEVPETEVRNILIGPGVTFEAEGYHITPVRASHGLSSSPLLYVIEKDGKRLFYGNDTGIFPEESWQTLKRCGKSMDLVSLDCTEGASHADWNGHLDMWRCEKVRDRMIAEGIAREDTVFVLNHFSHNGQLVIWQDLEPLAREHGFLVSYDGMTVDF